MNYLFRFLFSVLLLFIPLTLAPPSRESFPVQAQTQSSSALSPYACILEEAYFYSSPDEKTGLFLLPKTYYVKLVEYGSEYCKIEYLYDSVSTKKLLGYAKTNSLTFVDYVPTRPYLYYLFDVRYTINDSVSQDSSFLTQITVSCAYYGDFLVGSKTYCYVLQGESFGYVPKPDTLSFEENTEYADRLPPPTSSSDEPVAEKKNSSPTQIALLIALCLLVPVLASLIIKPPKRPPYEEE